VTACSITGCTRRMKYNTIGWCQTHYHRWYRTGTTEDPTPAPVDWWKRVTYWGAHTRNIAAFGKASAHACVSCGGQAAEWAYDGTDPTEIVENVRFQGRTYPTPFSRFPEFYMPMCTGCHRALDAGARSARRTECVRGHALTPENTYCPPGRGGRDCRTCRRDSARERARTKRLALRSQGLSSRGRLLTDPPARKTLLAT
jgi:hypothetical protein